MYVLKTSENHTSNTRKEAPKMHPADHGVRLIAEVVRPAVHQREQDARFRGRGLRRGHVAVGEDQDLNSTRSGFQTVSDQNRLEYPTVKS